MLYYSLRKIVRPPNSTLTRVVGSVLLFLLAYAVRAWQLAANELSFDEVATYFIANRSWIEVIRYVLQAAREHPPLYYLLISSWLQVAGTGVFALRYPSVLIDVLAVAAGLRLGRHLLGREAGWWHGLLLTAAPFCLGASRTARMYTLVLLLTLLTIDTWWQWAAHPTRRRWLCFALLAAAGALTHYYLILLWGIEGALLLLAPRHTRAIRWPWLATALNTATIVGIFLACAPGVREMLLETGGRFPVWGKLRLLELRHLALNLYLGWNAPSLWPAALAGCLLTLLGWGLAWHRARPVGTLLALWGLLPVALSHLVPEAMEARYFMICIPPLLLGLAATLTWLRPWLPRLLLGLLILGEAIFRWDHQFVLAANPFPEQVGLLHGAAQPTDALVLNGPWANLLFNYYPRPAFLTEYLVPQAAPPGFEATVDYPRLTDIVAQHTRLWVLYNAVQSADPEYRTSRWLAENTYCVYKQGQLALCERPSGLQHLLAADITFGPQLYLKTATANRQIAAVGETVQVRLDWEGPNLSWRYHVTLALLDAEYRPWIEHEFNLGPDQQAETNLLPTRWAEQRGLWLLPGLAPGSYTLALKVSGADSQMPEGSTQGWVPLGTFNVDQAMTPEATAGVYSLFLPLVIRGAESSMSHPLLLEQVLPQWAGLTADFGGKLRLVGLQPPSLLRFTQGYPVLLTTWWQVLRPPGAAQVQLRLIGRREVIGDPLPLGPTTYPASVWQTGTVIRQPLGLTLPEDLPPGQYHLQMRICSPAEMDWSVSGHRQTLTILERWLGSQVVLHGEWADILVIQVEARPHTYVPPLLRTRRDARFSDVLRLRGYQITSTHLKPGDSAQLTVYWQALQQIDRRYAAFNHLLQADGTLIWQKDSWPQAGLYTTERWRAGEVVAESYTIVIPPETPPGNYTLYTGLYDPNTIVRLAAVDTNGQRYINDQVPLLTITIQP